MRGERESRRHRRGFVAAAATLLVLLAMGSAVLGAEEEIDEDERHAVGRARLALAEELGTAEAGVAEEGVSFERFPNGALGCPDPGEMAAAVITPGWRVILRAGEDRYDVRVTEDGRLVRVCGKMGKATRPRPSAVVEQDLRAASRAASAARTDLAGALGVPETQVRRVWARPVQWPEGPRDCRHPDPAEPGGVGTDFVVLLEHEDLQYHYRVDREGVLPCGEEYGGDGS